jgi:DNA-directed RNA polymerase subunit N (RpoN/RPB10)
MVKPLECAICGQELSTAFGEDDVLVLRCFGCDTSITPGIATISRVNAVVKEHFVD